MKHTKVPLVVGNWKMNPASLADAKKLFIDVRKKTRSLHNVTIVVAPPAIFLSDLARLSPSGRVGIAAQNVWPEATGAQTGEISTPMVVSAGATYAIVGHSELRAQGMDDTGVHKRLQAVLRAKITPIVCVGELERDPDGEFFLALERQLRVALQGLKKAEVMRIIIAYEPVWAIGSGTTPTGADIYEIRLFIEKSITKLFDRATARKVTVLYGGSVNADNASALFHEGDVNGFLVGGASLHPDIFATVCKSVQTV